MFVSRRLDQQSEQIEKNLLWCAFQRQRLYLFTQVIKERVCLHLYGAQLAARGLGAFACCLPCSFVKLPFQLDCICCLLPSPAARAC